MKNIAIVLLAILLICTVSFRGRSSTRDPADTRIFTGEKLIGKTRSEVLEVAGPPGNFENPGCEVHLETDKGMEILPGEAWLYEDNTIANRQMIHNLCVIDDLVVGEVFVMRSKDERSVIEAMQEETSFEFTRQVLKQREGQESLEFNGPELEI